MKGFDLVLKTTKADNAYADTTNKQEETVSDTEPDMSTIVQQNTIQPTTIQPTTIKQNTMAYRLLLFIPLLKLKSK